MNIFLYSQNKQKKSQPDISRWKENIMETEEGQEMTQSKKFEDHMKATPKIP